MTQFFLPDGDGGCIPVAQYEEWLRPGAIDLSYWPASSFTAKRVHEVVSHHNGTNYRQCVGELTSDRKFIIAILESLDERGRRRFVAQTVYSQIHIDAEKVISVRYFD
ncbi:hypothetical protein [Nocardioides pakistanensis]